MFLPVQNLTAVAAPPVMTPLRRAPLMSQSRVRIDGRLFRVDDRDWYVKGFTYGPFAPNRDGQYLPERHRLLADFAQMRNLGCGAIRLYHAPPREFLDDALAHGIRVLLDVPWEKHRCFFEDWSSQQDAIAAVRKTARQLGTHPGTFAISVANEIPHDIVRFYGARRVEKFIENLVEVVKEEAPDCLATYTNYPSTEFLHPRNLDFYCANVYLHDGEVLGRYLDRLQHVAGNLPLILGEYGIDTIRESEEHQSEALEEHLKEVFTRGLAGSFIYSFTDDWFTGGHQIEDWAFGVTRRDRTPKPAAEVVANLWSEVPHINAARLPRVSVVVCSYNGAETLTECLNSLLKLDYLDYEVILVDDGSTDNTREIAAKFPEVRYVHQKNMGLSYARNVGAELATGSIVAYTDSDCVADPHWLLYLAQAMQDPSIDAVGGPNISPPSDRWTAKCVAAAPGGPSHVMFDDQRAEHVPGCNMAFRRDKLLALGGFDHQFRQAGDDVDICWRFIDAGMSIGYAPAALVWHHRRNTVRAYWKQQAGYGRSEAMLRLKHPGRFNRLGYSRWFGVIYGEGAVGLPLSRPIIYHGQFGAGLFQIIYRRTEYHIGAYFTLMEWHVLAALILALSTLFTPLAFVSAGMWLLTLIAAAMPVLQVRLPQGAPRWCRPLIFWMHLGQPFVRAWHRYKHLFKSARIPHIDVDDRQIQRCLKPITLLEDDLYFSSDDAKGREHLLKALVEKAQDLKWNGDFENEWRCHDVDLIGDGLHTIALRTATEELGWPKRFTRVRCTVQPSGLTVFLLGIVVAWTGLALYSGELLPMLIALPLYTVGVAWLLISRRRCRKAVLRLVYLAGDIAGLRPVRLRPDVAPRESAIKHLQAGKEELEPCLT
jgi:O-antigen biosynthesis protein